MNGALYKYCELFKSVFPVDHDKRPEVQNWTEYRDRDTTVEEIERWARKHYFAVVMGQRTGYVCLDADSPMAEEELKKLCGGEIPATLWYHTSHGNKRFFFKYPGSSWLMNVTLWKGEKGKHEELKFVVDHYVVLPMELERNGYSRSWPEQGIVEAAEMPKALLDHLYRFRLEHEFRQLQEEMGERFENPDNDTILSAMNALSPQDVDDYDTWITIGQVLHTLGDEWLDAWVQWSKKSDKYQEGECEKKWASFDRTKGRSIGTLFFYAQLNGWKPPKDDRPRVTVTMNRIQTNDEAIAALTKDTAVFQRDGFLVQIRRWGPDVEQSRVRRQPGSPQIVLMERATLGERLSACARFVVGGKKGRKLVGVPDWCVNGIHARGEWNGIRYLAGVIEMPVMRLDGSVICQAGYDEQTCLFLAPSCRIPTVPEMPTMEDAKRAAELLLGIICDFPFQKPAHRSVWLAYALTEFGKHSYTGSSPFFQFDANLPGTGKSLLCDLASLIWCGRPAAKTPADVDEIELRKIITSLVIAGDSAAVFDNATVEFGSASLDSVITSGIWKDRVLGESRTIVTHTNITWAMTGNRVALVGDLPRRTLPSILESRDEHPEERSGFKYENVRDHVLANRPDLIAAALTILRAYRIGGSPQKLTSFGGFEEWSKAVREPIVWLGLPDPVEPQKDLKRVGNPRTRALEAIHAAMKKIGREVSSKGIADWCTKNRGTPEADALYEVLGFDYTASSIGYKFRSYIRSPLDGCWLDNRTGTGRETIWFLEGVHG